MQATNKLTAGVTGGPDQAPALLLDVHQTAAAISASPRTVYRLCEQLKMPPGFKVGGLRRWLATDIAEWAAKGCPAVSQDGGADL
jgi:predicted DNA-binding transcriptional regulator AlpA